MPKPSLPDLIGRKFGRLTVVAAASPALDNQRRWRCECSCGSTKPVIVTTGRLNSRNVRSCGCLMRANQHANFVRRGGGTIPGGRILTPSLMADFDELNL